MQKYAAVHVVVLAGLVAAVTLLVFQCRALTFKVEALEAARDRAPAAPPPTEFSTLPPGPLSSIVIPPDDSAPQAPERRADPAAPIVAGTSEVATLTPAQEQAVATSVDRILKEKYGHLPKVPKPEELEKILEKELDLSASQKARIADLLKRKREELRALFEGEDAMAGATMKKAMEIERRYDAAIKSELGAAQQAKYDQLKKDGKIPQGLVVQIEAND